ncbi:formate dehydrogenase accessory sulfurtransferase FdhD [Okibacterium endophyticum]
MVRTARRRRIVRLQHGEQPRNREDVLAVEEPLEVRVAGRTFSVTMRTPGHDFDLVAGFLVSEGIVWQTPQLVAMRHCAGRDEAGEQTYNVIDATVGFGAVPPDTSMERHVYTSSSCGICGTTSIEAVQKSSHFTADDALPADDAVISLDLLLTLPDRLRDHQDIFDRTGGVHAAGLFDLEGNLLCLREDVGRHNAVDKVVGWALREGRLPLRDTVLQVSGRASFELVQKCHLAGIPIMTAVSAPSSLAVQLAESVGLTLAGFSRGTSINVYANPGRISTQVPASVAG